MDLPSRDRKGVALIHTKLDENQIQKTAELEADLFEGARQQWRAHPGKWRLTS
jgi:hypothetical protein